MTLSIVMCMILSQTVVTVLIYTCAQTCPAQNKIFQVEEDAMLIICTIDEKISQPDRRLSRAGLPTALYASLAATSKESSTHRIESSRVFPRDRNLHLKCVNNRLINNYLAIFSGCSRNSKPMPWGRAWHVRLLSLRADLVVIPVFNKFVKLIL